jgi:hypothetical protein
MDDDTHRWLVAEVERLSELKRADTRRLLKRWLVIMAMLAAAFAVGWHLVSGPAERVLQEIWVILPYGLGLVLVRRPSSLPRPCAGSCSW